MHFAVNYGRCLMSQNHTSQSISLRVNKFSRYRAHKIWKRNENFVPLQCQMKR